VPVMELMQIHMTKEQNLVEALHTPGLKAFLMKPDSNLE